MPINSKTPQLWEGRKKGFYQTEREDKSVESSSFHGIQVGLPGQ